MSDRAKALLKTMSQFNDPQPTPEFSVIVSDPAIAPPAPDKPALIAPLWHTLLIIALILANSFTGSTKMAAIHGSIARIMLYAGTFITQSILILIVWFGIRSRHVRMRDLIGGRWKTVESFLLDAALAIGFLILADAALIGLRIAVGALNLHDILYNGQKVKDDAIRMLGPLAPHTYLEAGLFVLLSIFASIFEEIIFRGYLQRQLGLMTQNAIIGIIASGVVFGLAHGYQGSRMMFVIAVFGILFGILAHLRKSLRPGMMAHAVQDSYSGIALFFLVRQ